MNTKLLVLLPGTIFSVLFPVLWPNPDLMAQTRSEVSYVPECNIWYAGGGESAEIIGPDANGEWQRIQTPVADHLLDVFFFDAENGWASHTGNGCMRSTDGGFNWITTRFDDTNFVTSYEGVYFVNQDTGWCVGGGTQIRKTTDGGVSWFKQHGPPVTGINRGVHFLDESTGYVIGSKNYPFEPFASRTSDGGSTWSELDVSVPGGQELIDQYWFNADTGWICGYNVLLYTTDAGCSFVNMFPNVPPTGNGHNVLFAIQFVNQDIGWIGAGNLENSNIYKTTDGGASWVFQDNPVSQNGWNQINDVMFSSPDSGWAAHGTPGTGAIMFTANGGADWVMDNTTFSWYDCLARYQDLKVWCGASEGGLWLKTPAVPTGVSLNDQLPRESVLCQNYPNPFNSISSFEFRLPADGRSGASKPVDVSLRIYDLLGREVSTVVDERLLPGTYTRHWDAVGQPTGTYFYRLSTSEFIQTRKLILLR